MDTASDQQAQNDFVSNSAWGDILQFWQWGEVKKEEGWQKFLVGESLRVRSMVLMKKVPGLGNYAYVPHGPVFESVEDLKAGIEEWKTALLQFAKSHNCFVIEIDPKIGYLRDEVLPISEGDEDLRKKNEIVNRNIKNLSHFYNPEILEILQAAGFKKTSRNMQPTHKLLYSLDLSDDELMSLMDKNTRYNIGYAERKGVQVEHYFPDNPQIGERLKVFYSLTKEMQSRVGGYPIRPYESFVKLFEVFKGTQNIVLFEASFEGDPIIMNISQFTKNWSSSFYAGSNRLHSNVKAPYLIRWKSTQLAREFGSKVYDFWGIIPKSRQHKGYSDHKLSFGGTRIDHVGLMQLPLNGTKTAILNNVIPLRTKIAEFKRKIF
ncbi:peptidoglycan bridge formation glycyltransferase FemA/FemB family protein [Candidatus Dojkabacteria bacterium]|nr:peptidoglycan bridge formation glycyltransferase FemA/FemB family protein [Candidatus Dojkabacteria bacterium]